jgi:hypothetical protein
MYSTMQSFIVPDITSENTMCLKVVVLDDKYVFGDNLEHTMRAYRLNNATTMVRPPVEERVPVRVKVPAGECILQCVEVIVRVYLSESAR